MKSGQPLPPLDYFVAFEAAAKSGSFAGASQVLNISESSISRKVKLLEGHFRVPLFIRGHRSISLTIQGNELLKNVGKSLDILRQATAEMQAHAGTRTVRLAATNSVASLWLLPKLRRFNQSNSQIQIMLIASDNDDECLSDDIDLAILRGDGNWPGFDVVKLFGETIFPVCSPTFLKRNPSAHNRDKVANLPLIDIASSHDEWMGWTDWLKAQGMELPTNANRTLVNTYPLAVQAAVDGLGIVLGWGHLVDHLLETGDLVRVADNSFERTQAGYFLLKRKSGVNFDHAASVERWLVATSAQRKRYAPESA